MSFESAAEKDDITGALCVFYSDSPFSDFAPYSFLIEGIEYPSVEHYFQIHMLRSFGLFKLATKLSAITDAGLFRRILRQNLRAVIQNGLFDQRMFDSWRATNAVRCLKRANRAKFEQNIGLKKQLLETGDRILVFTNKHDRLLGVGMDEMTFLDWVRQQRWRIEDLLDNFTTQDMLVGGILGGNLLGFCLMDIRAEMGCKPSVLSLWTRRSYDRREQSGIEEDGSNDVTRENEGLISVERAEFLVDVSADETDNQLTDDHILANLSNAESTVSESQTSQNSDTDSQNASSSSATIFRVPNEKRIVYRRPGYVQRVVGGPSDATSSKPSTSMSHSTNSVLADSQTNFCNPVEKERRKLAIERLKALQFEKPMINPFSVNSGNPSSTTAVSPNGLEYMKDSRSQPKLPRLCDIPVTFPLYGRRFTIEYPQLEPGEVPPLDYGPTIVAGIQPRRQDFQNFPDASPAVPCGSHSSSMSGYNSGLSAFPPPEMLPEVKAFDTGLWIPSSNPMKDVFESAKAGIKKLIENAKNGNVTNDEISHLVSFRPPPIQAQPDARKRKSGRRKAAPSYAGVFFNSKNAQMRHVSNRWVKGGRLTTTGKFEECTSDDDEDSEAKAAEAEVSRTLRQLEAIPDTVDLEPKEPDTPVQFHVVYEDTNEYSEYVKWYADVHGCVPSDVVDDEYQKYLRDWYRWYRTAVKFVDVEPLSDDGEMDCDEEADGREMNNQEKSQLLMQQWRWQQINEWELQTRGRPAASLTAQETCSDGVSVSGKPITYTPAT